MPGSSLATFCSTRTSFSTTSRISSSKRSTSTTLIATTSCVSRWIALYLYTRANEP